MALGTPTLLDTATGTAQASSIVSSSISPTASALLIVAVHIGDTQVNGVTGITDTLTGTGTWTERADLDQADGSGVNWTVSIWTATAGSSPGSGAITATIVGNANRRGLQVVEITGHDTTTPVAQSKTGWSESSTALSFVMDSTPASDSVVFAAVSVSTSTGATVSPGAQFTELAEVNTTGTPDLVCESQYDETSPATTVDWSFSQADSSKGRLGAAIEISAAAVGGISVPVAWHHLNKNIGR